MAKQQRGKYSIGASFSADGKIDALLAESLMEIDCVLTVRDYSRGTIRASLESLPPNCFGRFSAPSSLHLDGARGVEHQLVTLIHELGHAIDAQFIGGLGAQAPGHYWSRSAHLPASPLAGWWNAVRATDTYKGLATLAVHDSVPLFVRSAARGYFLDPAELWARSFSQYVEGHGKGRRIRHEWVQARRDECFGQIVHWSEKDFDVIEKAIQKLFGELGWEP